VKHVAEDEYHNSIESLSEHSTDDVLILIDAKRL